MTMQPQPQQPAGGTPVERELGPSPALRDCPFCGKPPDVTWRRSNPKARCATAGCAARKLPVISLDDAGSVAEWNTRDSAVVDAERERLCAALKLEMQHSAWDGALQLDDALRNIADMRGPNVVFTCRTRSGGKLG